MRKLLLFFFALLAGVSGAWAHLAYTITGEPELVTSTAGINASDYYILQNQGSSQYNYWTGSEMSAKSTYDASSLVQFFYDDSEGTIQVKQVVTETYYQGYTANNRLTLGASPVDLTFTAADANTSFRFGYGSGDAACYLNRYNSGDATPYPMGASTSFTGDNSKWKIYKVTVSAEVSVTLSSGFSGTFYGSNFYYDNGTQDATHGNWVAKCVTNTTVPVTLDFGANGTLSDWNCYVNISGSKVLNVSLPDGYAIKDISFTATLLDNYTVAATLRGESAEPFPYNTSATVSASNVYAKATAIAFNTNTDNTCRLNITDFTITIVGNTSVIEDGVYSFTSSNKNGDYYMTSTGGKTQSFDASSLFYFSRVESTNVYYIREMTTGKYLYTDKASYADYDTYSTTYGADASHKNRYHAAAVSTVESTTGNESGCKWIIEKSGTKYRIIPYGNQNTAIGSWGYSEGYWSFLEKDYDVGQMSFTTYSLSRLIDYYTVGQLTNGFSLDEIKAMKAYNKYVMSSSDQATYLDQTGFPTTEAYTNFESTFTTSGTKTAQAAIDALLASTIPSSGYYYIKNKGLNTYMFRDEAYDTYAAGMTLLNEESRTPKYIWKVDVSVDGTTANVTSLTGQSITASRSATAYTDMSITSAWLMGYSDGYGAYYMGCLQDPNQNGQYYTAQGSGDYASATNPRVVTYYDGDRSNTKAYWVFESVDVSDYDVYSVTIAGAPSNNYVEYTGSATTGNTKVYNGGYYFMTKDADVSESDFTAEAVDGYRATVSLDGKTLIVFYESYEDLATAFFTANIGPKMALSRANTVGYPTEASTGFSELNTATLAAEWNATTYATLLTKYDAYLAETTVNMPVDGKTYILVNKPSGRDDAKMLYLGYKVSSDDYITVSQWYIEGETNVASNYQYICHVKDGKYSFITKDGRFLVARGSTESAMTTSYDGTKSPCTIEKHPYSGGNVSKASAKEDVFGTFLITGARANNTEYKSVLLLNNDGGFNNAEGAYFNGTYSSAYYLIAADDYYNKVTLTSDGTDAYASIYLPFSVTIPTGVKAFAVGDLDSEKAMMEEIVGDAEGILPANTGAILKKYGQTGNSTIYLSPAEGAGSFSGTNLLDGTVATKTRESLGTGTTYVLGKIDDEIGLCEYTATDLAEGKAYLFVEATGGGEAKALTLYFGDETALDAVKTETVDKGPAYDLSGRRVERTTRGLYIQNGKKLVVK